MFHLFDTGRELREIRKSRTTPRASELDPGMPRARRNGEDDEHKSGGAQAQQTSTESRRRA